MSDDIKTEVIEVACRICGEPMQIEVPAAGEPFSATLRKLAHTATAHESCHATRIDDTRRARAAAARAERESTLAAEWEKMCPQEYRKEIDYSFAGCDPKKHAEVLRWSFDNQRGLILAGKTGRCKTRFLYDLLKREHFAGRKFFIRRHPEWRLEASKHAADSQDKLAHWLHRQAVAPLWVMDDLGKGTITPASEESLESLIDQRTRSQMPMIFTTNDSAKTLGSRLSADRGAPMLRRILGSCDVIRFEIDTTTTKG